MLLAQPRWLLLRMSTLWSEVTNQKIKPVVWPACAFRLAHRSIEWKGGIFEALEKEIVPVIYVDRVVCGRGGGDGGGKWKSPWFHCTCKLHQALNF